MSQFIWIMTNEDHRILNKFGDFVIGAWEIRQKCGRLETAAQN